MYVLFITIISSLLRLLVAQLQVMSMVDMYVYMHVRVIGLGINLMKWEVYFLSVEGNELENNLPRNYQYGHVTRSRDVRYYKGKKI